MADAGRVISGTARGVRLQAPGAGTRPMTDRVKGSLFGALQADPSAPLEGVFLDLYAGSGAAGIEALSRGAPAAVFVEHDAKAARVIAENLRRTGLDGGRVVRADVVVWLAGEGASGGAYRCVVADPPYADDQEALLRVLDALGGRAGLLEPEAVVVCKHLWRWTGPDIAGVLVRERTRRFGETAWTWYRAEGGAAGASRGTG
jgi:16S rRNA (guanine966-N2)-methyltransferase